MRSFLPTVLMVVCVFGLGCGTTRVTVVDASAEGGSVLVRGPEPNLAAHDYLAKACPGGYRIVSQNDEAMDRAVDLANVGVSTGATMELTYVCERLRALARAR